MFFFIFPYLFLFFILCLITIIDLREERIPDCAIFATIIVKIICTLILWILGKAGSSLTKVFLKLFLDGLAVSLPVLLLVLLIEKLWKKEVMGGGDIKLIFATGLYLGWEKNLWMLLLACVFGVIIGFIKLREMDSAEEATFPFGPMIAIATMLCMLYNLI